MKHIGRIAREASAGVALPPTVGPEAKTSRRIVFIVGARMSTARMQIWLRSGGERKAHT